MTKSGKRTLGISLGVAACIIAAVICRNAGRVLPGRSLSLLRSFIYIGLFMFWEISLRRRGKECGRLVHILPAERRGRRKMTTWNMLTAGGRAALMIFAFAVICVQIFYLIRDFELRRSPLWICSFVWTCLSLAALCIVYDTKAADRLPVSVPAAVIAASAAGIMATLAYSERKSRNARDARGLPARDRFSHKRRSGQWLPFALSEKNRTAVFCG